jgi:hypothetical protein
MKLEELIGGKNDTDSVQLDGLSLPVSGLKALIRDGYQYIKPYPQEKTISTWGKTCTGCFTPEELSQRA